MRRLFFAAALGVAFWALSAHPARAYVCAVPNIFVPQTAADANQMNANFSAVVQCLNSLDARNITGAIYASQFIPTTVGQATFGGLLNYTFPASIKLPSLAAGCLQINFGGVAVSSGHPCPLANPLTVANGGTGVAATWTTGQCFYYTGTVFAQLGCGSFEVAGAAPIVVDSTPPPTPAPTPTPGTTKTLMLERQTVLTQVLPCPPGPLINVLIQPGCRLPGIFPLYKWSSIIVYRSYFSIDGGHTWISTGTISTTGSNVDNLSLSTVITPNCSIEGVFTYMYCPQGTWTPHAPPALTCLDFSAPIGAPGSTATPSPPPSPCPTTTPSPAPTPTPTPLPPWLARLTLQDPLPFSAGGTGVFGTNWAVPGGPFGDELAISANNPQAFWFPTLTMIDRNGAPCQGGAHPGTPYCSNIAPMQYVWTGIPISLAGSSCPAITSPTQLACAEVDLPIPAYPTTGWAAKLAPYLNLTSLHAAQIADGATHIYQLADACGACRGGTSGNTPAADTGSSPAAGLFKWDSATSGCFPGGTALTPDQATAGSCENFYLPGVTLPFEDPPNTSHFTIELVVKPISNNTSGAGQSADAVSNGSGGGLGFEVQIGPSGGGFIVGTTGSGPGCGGGCYFTAPNPTFVNGKIYHVVATFTGSALNYYVNGQLLGTSSFTGSYRAGGSPNMLIAANPNNNSNNACSCIIEAVAIYSTALTAAQVSSHYLQAFNVSAAPQYATCAVDEEDAQYPMQYSATWLGAPGAVALRVWNSTGSAMGSPYTATVGIGCWGSWVNGF